MSSPISIPQKTINAHGKIQSLLADTGIIINGPNPWDIQVNHPDFFYQVLTKGSLGLGESYMQELWDCPRIDELINRLLQHNLDKKVRYTFKELLYQLHTRFFNLQNITRARIVGKQHYDLGNDLFMAMLDQTLSYSCGYWKAATTLYDAQFAKLDLIARKLSLEKGMRVLDIGCGWGSFAEHAARHYGCEVVGITISEAQANFARERCKELSVTIKQQDYRALEGHFDCIVSIGMFEHVGYKNYATFFTTIRRLLVPQGRVLLHTIGTNETNLATDPWLNKYIFPNGVLPSIAQLAKASEKHFVMEDWQNFGPDYDLTLQAWLLNLNTAWPKLSKKYSRSIYRMLHYYLMSCAGAFRARKIHLWQILFTDFAPQRYDAPR